MSITTLVLPNSLQGPEANGDGWATRIGLTKAQAEEFLDWLEVNGYRCRVVCITDTGFEVHYQEPSKVFRVHQPDDGRWAGLHYVLNALLKPFRSTASL